ncbi:hypothetical protein K491DRAFT_93584 [Lophiostoma macrostomum CBS 122681]|uniref:Uncharacterized protein n=1 Tax=Lophiostoma macrostomum CBS 122681 TaxID=1314788 RepID=A0A6A6TML9_9PLEO|nr:hypothetical protein K491DRAFT_93584 [Lophiostoma macrostomum CBS 122681]
MAGVLHNPLVSGILLQSRIPLISSARALGVRLGWSRTGLPKEEPLCILAADRIGYAWSKCNISVRFPIPLHQSRSHLPRCQPSESSSELYASQLACMTPGEQSPLFRPWRRALATIVRDTDSLCMRLPACAGVEVLLSFPAKLWILCTR